MIARLMSAVTAANLVNTGAALILIASPWLAGFTHDAIASSNALLCGMLMLSFTAAALIRRCDWPSWMNLVPGVWVFLSPFILGFTPSEEPTIIHVVVGLTVSILSLVELCRTETLDLDD